jgi:phasin
VTESNVKVEVNDPLSNTKLQANEKQSSNMPFLAMSGPFGGIAAQSVAQAKENYEKMKAASGEVVDIFRETCSTNVKGAADYGSKLLEISSANTNSAFDFLTHLLGTKSIPEIINLSTAQSRKSVEAASAQNRELWELARKVATETAEPVKKSFTRVLQKAS